MIQLSHDLAAVDEWQKMIMLGLSTFFVSEDLTTIAAGVMVSQDSLSIPTAFWGCFLGIFLGDGLLYVIGLVIGRPAMNLPVLRRMLPQEKVAACEAWFERNGFLVVILSRFLPGTRLPTYFAAGLMRSKASYFLLAAAIATAVWTPLLLGSAWFFGDRVIGIFQALGAHPLLVVPLSFSVLFGVFVFVSKAVNWRWRKRAQSRLHRFLRWEFWPIAVLYLPVFIQNLLLAIRYRSLKLPLMSNPAIEYSGIVGESKSAILNLFSRPNRHIPAYMAWDNVHAADGMKGVLAWMSEHQLAYPIIVKPDSGQRGFGVRFIRDDQALQDYLSSAPIPLMAQAYAPGPYEFGVYYVRMPGCEQGKVTGITGKDFPQVVGDGSSCLEDLILKLPQAQGRVHIFLKRFSDSLRMVLQRGERFPLVHAGNHCQGTIFLDHSHLLTPQLEKTIDEIAQSFDGLYICRMDIRANDLESFRNGDAFQIVEINGTTSEPSHIYDPKYSIVFAWRHLLRHWFHVWRIGAANRKAGVPVPSLRAFLKRYRDYRRLARYHLDAN
ncbi:MAG: VTT domain-containing protein [Acidobacteria bacterium]|nr:VTT domain-containing protein [Acidobacteriota bacterium]